MEHVPYVNLDMRVQTVYQILAIVIVQEVMVHLQLEFIQPLHLVIVGWVGRWIIMEHVRYVLLDTQVPIVIPMQDIVIA
jgi:hypothetical protein